MLVRVRGQVQALLRRLTATVALMLDHLGDIARGYAEVCRSPATDQLLRASELEDPTAGHRFRELMEASGIEPPDTDLLAWGRVKRHLATRLAHPHHKLNRPRRPQVSAVDDASPSSLTAQGSFRIRLCRRCKSLCPTSSSSTWPVAAGLGLHGLHQCANPGSWANTPEPAIGEVRRESLTVAQRNALRTTARAVLGLGLARSSRPAPCRCGPPFLTAQRSSRARVQPDRAGISTGAERSAERDTAAAGGRPGAGDSLPGRPATARFPSRPGWGTRSACASRAGNRCRSGSSCTGLTLCVSW